MTNRGRTLDFKPESRSIARKGVGWFYRKLNRGRGIAPFYLPPQQAKAVTPQSVVADLFYDHTGRTINKWTHYLKHYDLFFSRFVNTPVRMLEIGVFEGGSLELWRKYLGPQATIYGIDIDPRCASFADEPNRVRIGSQDDPDFLRTVVEEMGGVDLVLDDGSHKGSHIIASFRALFPLLSDGGLYVIEDMHADYSEFPGTRRNQSLSFIKRLIDDMHGPYHCLEPLETRHVGGLHLFDSMAFIEKAEHHRTANTNVP
jgi:cephalosporin hydroxylase